MDYYYYGHISYKAKKGQAPCNIKTSWYLLNCHSVDKKYITPEMQTTLGRPPEDREAGKPTYWEGRPARLANQH